MEYLKVLPYAQRFNGYRKIPLRYICNIYARLYTTHYDFNICSINMKQEENSGVFIIQKSPDWRLRRELRIFNICPTLRSDMGDNFPMLMFYEKRKQQNI